MWLNELLLLNLVREEELLRREMADFGLTKNDGWIPAGCLPHPDDERVRLNVGGQVRTERRSYATIGA